MINSLPMLYDRWLQIARLYGREMAIKELATGAAWTFARLADEAERKTGPSGPIVFPGARTAEFVVTVLRAWRRGQIVCPLEPDQPVPDVPLPPDGCVHLKTTSATAGRPRMVAFTAPQLAADADNIVATMGLRRDWPNVAVISLAHSYGFSNLITPLLLHGIPLMISDSSLPEAIRSAGKLLPEMTVAAVPALWRAWHDAGAIPASVRLGISAGAPLPLELESSILERTGLKVHNFYGATECGGIAYDVSARARSRPGVVGEAIRNVQLSLTREGCLEVRGAAVGETYWPDPSAELGGGRFVTGDFAEVEGGVISLKGRRGDRINVAGRKIEPEIIEDAVRSYPGVEECVVFGCEGGVRGRSEVIVAVVRAAGQLDRAALKDFLSERLPAWQMPRDWWFENSLEADARGKVSRAAWRQRYLAIRGRSG